MASEFDFLRGKWPKMAAIAADASRLVDIIPSSAMKSLEKFTLWSADIALDIYEIQVPGGATQLEKLEALQACGYVPVEVLQKFHNVRTAASRSVNDMNSQTDLANACLSDCREIGQWMIRESEKSGFMPTQQFTPEYRVPISGMNTHAPEPDMMPSGYRFNRFLRQYGAYVALAAVVVVAGLAVFGITRLFQDRTEEAQAPAAELFDPVESTFTPVPQDVVVAIEDTATPEVAPEPEYILVDNLPVAQEFEVAKLHVGEWDVSQKRPFQNANQTYESGLGMYLPSKSISESWGNDTMTYNLSGMYEKIQFDVFVDTEGSYGISSEYGSFEIKMFADGTKIYETDQAFYDDFFDDITKILPASTLQLKIQLIQKKGTKGTLDVVIGDFFLYPYEDATN